MIQIYLVPKFAIKVGILVRGSMCDCAAVILFFNTSACHQAQLTVSPNSNADNAKANFLVYSKHKQAS